MLYGCKITYDNGDVELLHLEDEKWEAIDSRASPHKVCINFFGNFLHYWNNLTDENILLVQACDFRPREW